MELLSITLILPNCLLCLYTPTFFNYSPPQFLLLALMRIPLESVFTVYLPVFLCLPYFHRFLAPASACTSCLPALSLPLLDFHQCLTLVTSGVFSTYNQFVTCQLKLPTSLPASIHEHSLQILLPRLVNEI